MGLEQRDRVRRSYGRNNWERDDDGKTGKPFNITKKQVYEAYKAVNNQGAGIVGFEFGPPVRTRERYSAARWEAGR
jgi:hypothetical protein